MKFALILCAVFALSWGFQAHARVLNNIIDEPIERARNGLENLIVSTSNEVQSALDKAQENFDKYDANARKWIETTIDKVHRDLKEILKKTDQEIKNLDRVSEEKGTYLGDCERIAHNVSINVMELFYEAKGCVIDRIYQVTKDIISLKEKVSDVKNTLYGFLNTAVKCVNDPTTTDVKIVSCLTRSNERATDQIITHVPPLLFELSNFTTDVWVSPLPNNYCITNNDFWTSVERSKKKLNDLRQCLRK